MSMSSFPLLVVLRPLHSISLSLSTLFSHPRLTLSLEVSPEIRELIANGVTLGSTSHSHKTAWGVLNAVCQRAFSSFGSILMKANPSRECDNRSGSFTGAQQENFPLFISKQHAQSICCGMSSILKVLPYSFLLLLPSVCYYSTGFDSVTVTGLDGLVRRKENLRAARRHTCHMTTTEAG